MRARWRGVARDEQSAEAARTIEKILTQSHRRDAEVAAEERRVAGCQPGSFAGVQCKGLCAGVDGDARRPQALHFDRQ